MSSTFRETPATNHAVPALDRPRIATARIAATCAGLLGLTALLGWILDVPALRSVVPGAVEMKANTAVGLIAVSLSLWWTAVRVAVLRKQAAAVLAAGVAFLGAATLWQYGFGTNLGIDELLVRDSGSAFNQIKGRMSPYTALSFLALGLALLGLASRKTPTLARSAAGLATAIGIVSLIGYAWNASEIVTDRIAPPVALNTAVAIALLGAAVFAMTVPLLSTRQRTGQSRLERLVLGGFVPIAVLVVVGGGLTYESGASFSQTAEMVAHTQEVRAELGRLYGAVDDAELARRNQLLTFQPEYEHEFAERANESRALARRLQPLVADNPAQAALGRRLAEVVDARLASLVAVGAVFAAEGVNAARARLAADARLGLAARMRSQIREMDSAEATLLEGRLERARDQRRTTLLMLLATLALSAGLFSVLFNAIRSEIIARRAAEQELQRFNAALEERVAQRTRELSFQQAFLRRALDLNPNLIFAKDGGGRFVLANEAIAQALGTTVDALLGRREVEFDSDSGQVDGFENADRQVLESGRELVIDEERFVDAGGRERWLSTIKRPMQAPDGATPIVLGVSVDITARKVAQDQVHRLNVELEQRVQERTRDLLESNAQLEQARLDSEAASRAKSGFLANMSHEIRTPMNAIIGLNYLALRDARDATQRDRLAKVGDAAQHLLRLINDILDMSKIESGKMLIDEQEFGLDALLSGAVGMVADKARDKGLELVLDTDSLPQRMLGDPTRLSQVLINLLANAVKFTEHGWVRLRCRIVAEESARMLVRFEVQDTGPGIPLERQAALFKPFEQADNSISREYGGTGLGLALSREFALAMGGDAGVTSAPGAGSIFWFTARLGRAPVDAARTEPVTMAGLRALLIDDLPESLSVISEHLQTLHVGVDALASGVLALPRVEAERSVGQRYDVMLIDWRMEPIDGIETLRRLRAAMGESTPPAILVTAFDDPDLARMARDVGFAQVLQKPLTMSVLHDALANLQRRRPAPPARPAELREQERRLRSSHAGRRVLLAEDNPVNRELAEELLRSAGLVVETAVDGARAVEMAMLRPYDLVLMDMQMPTMDGLEATRAIRAEPALDMPIIAMTANAFTEDRDACLSAGMNDHITKPVDPAVLFSTLLRWLPSRESPAGGGAVPAVTQPAALSLSLREALADLPALDVEAALRNVAQQAPILERALRRFVKVYARGLPDLLDISGSDADIALRWRTTCHSMRSVLGLIGARSLLDELIGLEAELVDGVPPLRLQARGVAIHDALLRLVAGLDSRLGGD